MRKIVIMTKISLVLLISLFLIAAIPDDAEKFAVATNETINFANIIKKNGKDYIIDKNGIELEILENPDEAAIGEVIYFGKYKEKKIPFLVVGKKDNQMVVVSIPKFNFARESAEYGTPQYYDNFYESIAFLNTTFINDCFDTVEKEKIIEKVYHEIYTHFENADKFNLKYEKEKPNEKYGGSYIPMKIFEQFDYGNTYYMIDLDFKKHINYDELMDFRNSVWYLKATNSILQKKVDFYDVDIKIDLGLEKYTNYKRVVLNLKYEDNEVFYNKTNGFKELDDGLYYFENNIKLSNVIRSKNGVDYYLDDDGKAYNLKTFKIEKVKDIPIFTDGKIIGRNIIIENGKKYVDFNGVVHDLHSEYIDFKNAKISDSIVFGHEKDDENKKLIWRVVNVEAGLLTVIMEDTIKFWSYCGTKSTNVANRQIRENDCFKTWEESERREYLNNYFYVESFTDFEKGRIVANNITTDAFFDSDNFAGTGHDTLDKVFFFDKNGYEYMNTYEEQGKILLKEKPNIYNKKVIEHNPYSGIDKEIELYNFKLSENSFNAVRPWILINTIAELDYVNTKNTNEDYKFVASVSNALTANELLSVKDYKYLWLGHYQKADDETWYEERGGNSVEINRRVNWQILGVDEDTVYYITQNTIDIHPIKKGIFGTSKGKKWSETYIRQWLNNEFINEIFDESEKDYLKKLKKTYTYVDANGELKKEECEDYITLLSYNEYNLYEKATSGGSITSFAMSKAKDEKVTDTWALSTIDLKTGYFYAVNKKDKKIELLKSDSIAIRPCIAVKRSKLDVRKNLPDIKNERDKSYKIKYQHIFKNNLYADTINFGKYDIDGTGKKDLKWQIVTRKQNYALVISKDILFYENFVGKYNIPSWNKSDLRKKLNTSFYNEAFTDDEKKKIRYIKNYTKYNIIKVGDIDEDDETQSGEWDDVLEDETIDRLFIPKAEDFKARDKYFDKDMSILKVEEPLNNLNQNMPDGEDGVYWLREADKNGFYAIDKNGYVAKDKERKNKTYGVRPMMWIEME